MRELKLLNPEVARFPDGTPIRDRETRRTVVNKKCTVVNKDKSSKAKTYMVDEPTYRKYLKMKNI